MKGLFCFFLEHRAEIAGADVQVQAQILQGQAFLHVVFLEVAFRRVRDQAAGRFPAFADGAHQFVHQAHEQLAGFIRGGRGAQDGPADAVKILVKVFAFKRHIRHDAQKAHQQLHQIGLVGLDGGQPLAAAPDDRFQQLPRGFRLAGLDQVGQAAQLVIIHDQVGVAAALHVLDAQGMLGAGQEAVFQRVHGLAGRRRQGLQITAGGGHADVQLALQVVARGLARLLDVVHQLGKGFPAVVFQQEKPRRHAVVAEDMCFCIRVEHLVDDVSHGKGQKLRVAHLFFARLLAHAGHQHGIGRGGQRFAVALRVAQGVLRADASADQGGQERFAQKRQADLKALLQLLDIRPLAQGFVQAVL